MVRLCSGPSVAVTAREGVFLPTGADNLHSGLALLQGSSCGLLGVPAQALNPLYRAGGGQLGIKPANTSATKAANEHVCTLDKAVVQTLGRVLGMLQRALAC